MALWASCGVGFHRQRPRIGETGPYPRISPVFSRSVGGHFCWREMLRAASPELAYISDNFPYPPITSGMLAPNCDRSPHPEYACVRHSLQFCSHSPSRPQTVGRRCPHAAAPSAAPLYQRHYGRMSLCFIGRGVYSLVVRGIIDSCTGTRYDLVMIRSFRHRGLRRLYERGDPSRIAADQLDRVTLALADLDAASRLSDLDLPGYRLHPLRGDRRGSWSISISGNWRITFRFEDGDVYDVALIDYH